jgi:small redox-active disulfide protein 2
VKVQILGTGCPNCKRLLENTVTAAGQMGISPEVEKVEDIREIVKFGVMSTPALVVDGQVKVAGRVPTVDEIKALLQ